MIRFHLIWWLKRECKTGVPTVANFLLRSLSLLIIHQGTRALFIHPQSRNYLSECTSFKSFPQISRIYCSPNTFLIKTIGPLALIPPLGSSILLPPWLYQSQFLNRSIPIIMEVYTTINTLPIHLLQKPH